MANHVSTSQVAASIPFDNSTNGLSSTNLQDAIQEVATTKILEYTADPVSPPANSTWVLKTAQFSPIGLLLSLTQEIDTYQLSYKTASGSIKRVLLT